MQPHPNPLLKGEGDKKLDPVVDFGIALEAQIEIYAKIHYGVDFYIIICYTIPVSVWCSVLLQYTNDSHYPPSGGFCVLNPSLPSPNRGGENTLDLW